MAYDKKFLLEMINHPDIPEDEKQMFREVIEEKEGADYFEKKVEVKEEVEVKVKKPVAKKKFPKKKKKTMVSAETIDKAKAAIKKRTGKTEEECEKIVGEYRKLRGKATKRKKKETERVSKLKKDGKVIKGTDEKTPAATIDTTARQVENKIEKAADKIERKAIKEVSTKNISASDKKEEVSKKVSKKIAAMTRSAITSTNKLISSTLSELKKVDKTEAKDYLLGLRAKIDTMLKKFNDGGMVQGYDIQEGLISVGNNASYERGGKLEDKLRRIKNLSDKQLVARINSLYSRGQNDDDEVGELFRRSEEKGFKVIPKFDTYEIEYAKGGSIYAEGGEIEDMSYEELMDVVFEENSGNQNEKLAKEIAKIQGFKYDAVEYADFHLVVRDYLDKSTNKNDDESREVLLQAFENTGIEYDDDDEYAKGGKTEDSIQVALYGVINARTIAQAKPHAKELSAGDGTEIGLRASDSKLYKSAKIIADGGATDRQLLNLKRQAVDYMGRNQMFAKGGSVDKDLPYLIYVSNTNNPNPNKQLVAKVKGKGDAILIKSELQKNVAEAPLEYFLQDKLEDDFAKGGKTSKNKAADSFNAHVDKWVMFSYNWDTGADGKPTFFESFGDKDTSLRNHLYSKWRGYYESEGSGGVMNRFWSELSKNNQEKLADWIKENYTSYAHGGDVSDAKNRLEELRIELRREMISYGELQELESLKHHIDKDDVELRQAAGMKEMSMKDMGLMDSNYAKGGEIIKSIDEFKNRGTSYVNVDGERMIDWEDDFSNYIMDRIDLDERRKIREDWNRKEKENRAKGIKGGKEMRWDEYLLKEVNKKSYAKGGSIK